MKLLLLILFFAVCHARNYSKTSVLNELCKRHKSGPPCLKLKTFYWSVKAGKCKATKYLIEPCSFFLRSDTCNKICSTHIESFDQLEEFVHIM
ncbi:uncharacterized protein Dana_GF26521 [Drosophila ananassae]|uniref:BPTI/Kunitz inhibitor domain-containing protein n=1 Tax=Drosophila ananassae TaxID=7217 RepID=A0A0P8Y3K4_DROAN|nr:uncharacterized protein Dana_GF26521 [Drosophila ananassae]